MNDSIAFGQYVPGNSWIYKLDPRLKIALTILFIVTIFLIPSLELMVLALIIYIVLLISTRIPVMKVLKGIKGIIFLLLFTGLLQLIYIKSTVDAPVYSFDMSFGLWHLLIIIGLFFFYVFTRRFMPFKMLYLLLVLFIIFCVIWNNPFDLFKWNFNNNFNTFKFDVYEVGLKKAGYIFLRIVIMIGLTSLLTLSTMSIDINNGLESLLSPLKVLHINVGVFSMLISLTLRFIPTLMLESKKIMNAQASRGVDYNEGSLREKIRQIIALLIPLFVISFKKAEDLSNAMEARGYVIGEKRTKLDELKLKLRDYIVLIISLTIFGLVIWSRFI